MNEIAKGGKVAIDQLSNRIKSKINSTKRVTTSPDFKIQVIQDTSCPPTSLDRHLNYTSTNCVPQDEKSTANIACTTPLVRESKVFSHLPNLFTTSVQETSSASIFKNKSEKYVKALEKIVIPLTTIRIQTHKIEIPSSPDSADNSIGYRKNASDPSKSSNNLTAAILSTMDALKKYTKALDMNITIENSTRTNHDVNGLFLETTYLPVIKITVKDSSPKRVIILNHSKDVTTSCTQTEIQSSPSVERSKTAIHLTIPRKPSSSASLENETYETLYANYKSHPYLTNSTASIKSRSTLALDIRKVKSTTTYKESDNTYNIANLSLNTAACDMMDTKSTHSLSEKDNFNYSYKISHTSSMITSSEDFEEDVKNITLNNKIDEEFDNFTENNCEYSYNTRTEMDEERQTAQKPDSSTRRPKLTTQMLSQKIFSPTLIDCSKQKNGSVLVIKLISHSSEKPFELEQLIQKAKLWRSKPRHRLNNVNVS